MKFTTFATVLCLASAVATTAPAASTMDPAALGSLDALLSLCVKADASDREIYQKLRTELIVFDEGTPYEMRAPGFGTPAYKAAYTQVAEAAGKIGREKLEGICRQTIGRDEDNHKGKDKVKK